MKPDAHRALLAHTTPIIRAIKVIVREQILVSTKPVPNIPSALGADLILAGGRPLELRTDHRRGRLWLGFRQSLIVQSHPEGHDSYLVVMTSTTYQLFRGDERSKFDEVVTYHWTPNDPNAKRTWPHLHVGSAFIDIEARREPWSLHKTHLVTGPVSAAAFVRMAVEEFDVRPVVSDWESRVPEPVAHS
ncbi:MAG: hypothetical protein QM589_03215 [Thermomicrobiales bacterium]